MVILVVYIGENKNRRLKIISRYLQLVSIQKGVKRLISAFRRTVIQNQRNSLWIVVDCTCYACPLLLVILKLKFQFPSIELPFKKDSVSSLRVLLANESEQVKFTSWLTFGRCQFSVFTLYRCKLHSRSSCCVN